MLPDSKIILYIGNMINALKNLEKHKVNTEQLLITNDADQLLGWLIQEINGELIKKQILNKAPIIEKSPPKDKFQKQDWEDYFSVIKEGPKPGISLVSAK